MQNQFIKPLMQATQNVIKSLINPNVIMHELNTINSNLSNETIGICIGIIGAIRGQVLFLMENETAFEIASKLTMKHYDKFDEISASAVCELCNMILGNAASNLYAMGAEVDITTPAFLTGDDLDFLNQEINTSTYMSFTINDNSEINVGLYISDAS